MRRPGPVTYLRNPGTFVPLILAAPADATSTVLADAPRSEVEERGPAREVKRRRGHLPAGSVSTGTADARLWPKSSRLNCSSNSNVCLLGPSRSSMQYQWSRYFTAT